MKKMRTHTNAFAHDPCSDFLLSHNSQFRIFYSITVHYTWSDCANVYIQMFHNSRMSDRLSVIFMIIIISGTSVVDILWHTTHMYTYLILLSFYYCVRSGRVLVICIVWLPRQTYLTYTHNHPIARSYNRTIARSHNRTINSDRY